MLFNKKIVARRINLIAYSLLGLLFAGYSTIGSNFSEIHIQFRFLNFPIFIGEITLFILIVLALLRSRFEATHFESHWIVVFTILMTFIVLKAVIGYVNWGPLAFRNAAIFYYILYAFFTYYFYDPVIMEDKVAIPIAVFLALVPTLSYFNSYFLWTYVALFLFFLSMIRRNWLRFLLCAYVLFLYPFRQFFEVGRGPFLANIAAMTYVIVWFALTIRMRNSVRIATIGALTVLVIFISLFGMDKVSRKRILAIFDFERWQTQYGDVMALSEKRLSDYQPQNFEVKVYEPNTTENIGIAGEWLKQQRGNQTLLSDRKISSVPESERNLFQENLSQSQLNQEVDVRNNTIGNEILSSPQSSESEKPVRLSIDSVFVAKAVLNAESFGMNREPRSLIRYIEKKIEKQEGVSDVFLDLQRENEKVIIKNREDQSRSSLVWRFLLWQDVLGEMKDRMLRNPAYFLFGFDFGKPIRSKRQEAILLYFPQITGWIEPHNFVLHYIYRSGIIGAAILSCLVWLFCRCNLQALKMRDRRGILLFSVLIYWFFFSITMVVLELPHYAIGFWSVAGLAVAWCKKGKAL